MKYLLPCKCGQSVEIEPSQAGQTVVCVCGEHLHVPSMLQIKALPPAQEQTPPARKETGVARKMMSVVFFVLSALFFALSLLVILNEWTAITITEPFLALAVYVGLVYALPILAIIFSSLGCAAALEDEIGILRKMFLILGFALLISSLVFAVNLYKTVPQPRDVSLKQVFFSHGTIKRLLFQDSTPIDESEHQILWMTNENIDQMMPMDLYFYYRTLEKPTFSYNYIDNYQALKDTHNIKVTATIVLFVISLLSIVVSFFMPRRNAVVTGWSGSDWR